MNHKKFVKRFYQNFSIENIENLLLEKMFKDIKCEKKFLQTKNKPSLTRSL